MIFILNKDIIKRLSRVLILLITMVVIIPSVFMFKSYNVTEENVKTVASVQVDTNQRDIATSRAGHEREKKITYNIYKLKISNGEIFIFDNYDIAKNNCDKILKNTNGIKVELITEQVESLEGIKMSNDTDIQKIIGKYPIKTTFFPTNSRKVNSPYGNRPSMNDFHGGIDLAGKCGDPIYAYKSGVVIESTYSNQGFGNTVVVDHGNGLKTRYAHMSKRIAQKGQKVKGGEKIGLIGKTGNATGYHLHFEVTVNGNRVNPYKYIFK